MAKNSKYERMTLMELQDVLGGRVRAALDDSLTEEERQIENEQSILIMNIAKQYINGADLTLRWEKLQAQTKGLVKSRMEHIIGEADA